MQTIFHFAGLSRCRDCLQLNQVKMSVRLSCACDFIWANKWRIKLQTPQWDYETQRARRKHSAGQKYCASDKKSCSVSFRCGFGMLEWIQWLPLHKQWTRPRALQIRLVSLSFFDGRRSFQFRRRWTVTVGELVAAATTNWVVIWIWKG